MNASRGFSLIEVMVALVISMVLLLALSTLLVQTNNNHRELSKLSRQIENGTYATLMLGDDLKHAGFYGLYSALAANDPAVMPNPCVDAINFSTVQNSDDNLVEALRLPIQGYNDPAAAPIDCINNYLPNTDVLVIRRVNTNFADIDVVNATNQLYLQSDGTSVVIDTGAAGAFTLNVNPADAATVPPLVKNYPAAPIFEYFTHIYYVSACMVCGVGGDTIPTLYRAYLNANGNLVNEPLVDGIEQFQVEYGLDTNGNDAPETFVLDPTVAGNLATTIQRWRQVVAVRLYILARNTEETLGVGNLVQKTYNLGSLPGAIAFTPATNDRYKRHLFTSTIKLRNQL